MVTGFNAFAAAGTVYGLGQVPKFVKAQIPMGVAFVGVTVELWQNVIVEELFPENSFIKHSVDASEYVVQGSAVYIPQSAGAGTVYENPQSFPLKVEGRADSVIGYELNLFATAPRRVANMEQYEISYDKMASIMREDLSLLNQKVYGRIMYNWVSTPAFNTLAASVLPVAKRFSVSGENGVGNADAPGATGNRKMSSIKDMQYMKVRFQQENAWVDGHMYAMLSPNMLAEIAPADSVVTATYMQSVTEEERRAGVYMKIQGWKILERSSVLATSADKSVIRDPNEVRQTTDQGASLFWNDMVVERAVGSVHPFEQKGVPMYLGDIFNMEVKFGGRCRRADYKGIAILCQAATN